MNNISKKLNKLEYIVVHLSGRHDNHKKNYNAGAVLVMRSLPTINNRYGQYTKERFRKIFSRYASVVNQTARSPYARQIANNPFHIQRIFHPNVNRFRSRSSTPNVNRFRSRSSTPNVNTKSRTCQFKKLNMWGRPVCK
jgi:hypothetical protein